MALLNYTTTVAASKTLPYMSDESGRTVYAYRDQQLALTAGSADGS